MKIQRNKVFAVIIGDIKDSQKMTASRRIETQKKLNAILDKVQKQYSKEILSPLKMTLGDEFQSVLPDATSAWQITKEVEKLAAQQKINLRYTISEDLLYTPINKIEPLKMDGPAFWTARELMDKKQQKYSLYVALPLLPTISILLEVIEDIEKRWSEVQREYVQFLQDHPNAKFSDLAKKFDKNPSTITRTLQSARFELFKKINNEITFLLSERKI